MESEVMNLYSTRPAKPVYAKNVIPNVFKTLPKLIDSHEFGFIDTIKRLIRKFICFLKNMIYRCASTKSKQENLLKQSIKVLKEKNMIRAYYNNDKIIRAITKSNNILESLKKEAITNPVSFIERVRQLANKIQPYLTPTLQKTFENILDTCSEKDIKLFFERASILEDYSEQKIELLFERAKVPANRSKKDIKLFFERTKISENCSEQEIELLKKLFAEHPRIPKNFAELTVFRDIVFLGKPLTDSQCEEAILQALAREFVKTKMSPKKSEDLSNNIHEHLKLTNKINQMSSEATGEIDKDKTMQEQKNLWLQMHQIDPKSEKVLCFSKGSTLGKGKLGTTKLVAQEAIESMLSKNIIKECNPKLNQMHQVDPKSEKVPCFSEDSILGEGAFGTTQLVAPGDSGFILVKKTLKECNPKLNQPFKHKMNNPHCIPVIPVNFKDKDKFQYMVSGGAALEGYIFNFRVMRELIKYGVKKVEKIPKMQTLIYSCSSEPGARPKDCISKLKNLYSSCDKYDREDLENYLSSIELQIILGIQKNWQTLKLLDDCGDLYELNRKDIEELIFLIDKDLTKVKVSAQRKFLKKCKDLCKAWQQEMKYSYTDGLLPLKELRHILKNMFTGVNNMHQQGITHGDIHSGNIVTDGDKLYFIDFDAAQYFPEDETKVNNTEFEQAKTGDIINLYNVAYPLITGLNNSPSARIEDLISSRPYQHERKEVNELFDVLNKLYHREPLDEILKLPFFSEKPSENSKEQENLEDFNSLCTVLKKVYALIFS